MAELIVKSNNTCDLKFHAVAKSFNRTIKVKVNKLFYNLHIDKNDSVCDVTDIHVISWKTVKHKQVPDKINETRNLYLFDRIVGNPSAIGMEKLENLMQNVNLRD